MILINASSYVNAEFEAEIGRIPPCMLPIGNKKLLQLQVDVVRQQFPNEKFYCPYLKLILWPSMKKR